jgi:hypothetical protein
MAERQVVGNVMRVGFAHVFGTTEMAFAFGGLVSQQMTLPGAAKYHFAGGADFEPLRSGLLCLRWFPAWHGLFPS